MSESSSLKVLFIGLVWPEPTSSAAGYRILQLVDILYKNGYEIHFASAAQKSDRSFVFDKWVKEHQIELNNDSFNGFISDLNPAIVVYDRFMIEEQYGWRVREHCANALTILDTEDLHFVRKAREVAFKKNEALNLYTNEAKRELASILRCDFSLIISKAEIDLLTNTFSISSDKLLYLPFIHSAISEQEFSSLPDFTYRSNFCFIGNFIHEPNYQTVLQLKKVVWPIIRKQLPNEKLFIYGAYPSQKVWDLHNEKEGFIVVGEVDSVKEVFIKHKVLIAPIPFGAGIKGKFFDAAIYKIPNVTSLVGVESMTEDLWNGFFTDDVDEFAKKSVQLYIDEMIWNEKVKNGLYLVNEMYSSNLQLENFLKKISDIRTNIEAHRKKHFLGEVLYQQQLQATKFLSLWIVEKNKWL